MVAIAALFLAARRLLHLYCAGHPLLRLTPGQVVPAAAAPLIEELLVEGVGREVPELDVLLPGVVDGCVGLLQ